MDLPTINLRGLTVFTTWPWLVKPLRPIDVTIQQVKSLGADAIAPKISAGFATVGSSASVKSLWGGVTADLAVLAPAEPYNLKFSAWCSVNLASPVREARLIKSLVNTLHPTELWLDAEATAKKYIKNLRAFLTELGRLPCTVYLQSYRWAPAHSVMNWRLWYSFVDEATGQYVIDGLGHQFYPLGLTTTAKWIADHARSLASHQIEIDLVDRGSMHWKPTLPTFIGGTYEGVPGWTPKPDVFVESTQFIVETLGDRLNGFGLWCLDRHLYKLPNLAQAISDNFHVVS